MANVPDKCSRCGAPISWEEGASSVKCDFCGKDFGYLDKPRKGKRKKRVGERKPLPVCLKHHTRV